MFMKLLVMVGEWTRISGLYFGTDVDPGCWMYKMSQKVIDI